MDWLVENGSSSTLAGRSRQDAVRAIVFGRVVGKSGEDGCLVCFEGYQGLRGDVSGILGCDFLPKHVVIQRGRRDLFAIAVLNFTGGLFSLGNLLGAAKDQ